MRLLNRTLAMLGLVGTLSLSLLAPVQAADYWYYVGADIHDNTTSIDNSSVDKEDDVAPTLDSCNSTGWRLLF